MNDAVGTVCQQKEKRLFCVEGNTVFRKNEVIQTEGAKSLFTDKSWINARHTSSDVWKDKNIQQNKLFYLDCRQEIKIFLVKENV